MAASVRFLFFDGVDEDVCVGGDDSANADELLFFFRVAVGFCHGCVLVYDVEDIYKRVRVDVLALCGLDAFFMQFLVRDVTIGVKEVCHEVDDGALNNSFILIYLGHEDRLV